MPPAVALRRTIHSAGASVASPSARALALLAPARRARLDPPPPAEVAAPRFLPASYAAANWRIEIPSQRFGCDIVPIRVSSAPKGSGHLRKSPRPWDDPGLPSNSVTWIFPTPSFPAARRILLHGSGASHHLRLGLQRIPSRSAAKHALRALPNRHLSSSSSLDVTTHREALELPTVSQASAACFRRTRRR